MYYQTLGTTIVIFNANGSVHGTYPNTESGRLTAVEYCRRHNERKGR